MDSTALLDNYFKALEADHQYSGVVLITRGAAQLYAGSYGYASRAWGVRNTLDMRFDTASVTKLFTSIATLQLIEQGRLAFDTSAIDFLELEGTAISRDVTAYHLLTHTSGIADDAEEEAGESYADLFKTKANYSIRTTADFLPQFVHKPPNFAPGQGCRYCNVGYVLLGLMIERASGMPYRDYVRQNVFARAGMRDSEFFEKDRVHPNVAEGCDPIRDEAGAIVGWQKNIYLFPPVGSPDGGAYVTAGDLDRFLRAVQAGRLLSPELTQAFLTPHVYYRERGELTLKIGYGVLFFFDQAGQLVCYQKEGINAGVSGVIRHYPAHDINLVLLSNMEEGAWDPLWHIHDLVVAGAFGQ